MARKKEKISPRNSFKYSYWTSETGLEIIQGLLIDGETIESICKEHIGISRQTFYSWCHKNETLQNVCMMSLKIADSKVNNALFKSAIGFTQNGFYYPPNPKSIAIYMERRIRNTDKETSNRPQVNISIQYSDGQSDAVKDLDKDLPQDEVLKDE